MVNHKEILRLKSLGLTHREITDATGCGRNTVTRTLARAREQKLSWQQAQSMLQQEVSQRLFPTEQKGPVYKMPDYEWVHREMQKSGVREPAPWGSEWGAGADRRRSAPPHWPAARPDCPQRQQQRECGS